ncbi:MAG: hypothetical protein ACM3U2_12350 [Deltaproteobacteria bacterium]
MLRKKVMFGLVAGCVAVAGAWALSPAQASADDAHLTVTPAVYRVNGASAPPASVQLVRHHGYYGGGGWRGGYRGYGWGGGYRGYGWGGGYRGYGWGGYYRPYYARPYYGYSGGLGYGYGYGYPGYGYGGYYGGGYCW